jgi:hypothetical protein
VHHPLCRRFRKVVSVCYEKSSREDVRTLRSLLVCGVRHGHVTVLLLVTCGASCGCDCSISSCYEPLLSRNSIVRKYDESYKSSNHIILWDYSPPYVAEPSPVAVLVFFSGSPAHFAPSSCCNHTHYARHDREAGQQGQLKNTSNVENLHIGIRRAPG